MVRLIRKHFYYILNDEGIVYLKEKLGITQEDVKPRSRVARKELLDTERRGRGRGRGMRGGRGNRFGAKRDEAAPTRGEAVANENVDANVEPNAEPPVTEPTA